jgi:hypothetical protein
MGALDASGISYSASDSWWNMYGGVYIDSLDGRPDAPPSGWMFAVNGNVPMTCANNVEVHDGDTVTWFYSEGMDSNPGSSSYVVNIHVSVALATPTATATPTPIPTPQPPRPANSGNMMLPPDVSPGDDTTMAVLEFGEASLSIKSGIKVSLNGSAWAGNITMSIDNATIFPDSDRIVCGIYVLGPFGAIFDSPVSIAFTLNASGPMDGLYIAYYDESTSEWVAVANQTVDGHNITASVSKLACYTVMKSRPDAASSVPSSTPVPSPSGAGAGCQAPVAMAAIAIAFVGIASLDMFATRFRKK